MKQDFIAVQYLTPKKLAVIVAVTLSVKPPPILVVMMNRKTNEIEILEATL